MGTQKRHSSSAAFARIELRSDDRSLAERLVAEAYAAGAVGLEEREGAAGLIWDLYAPATLAAGVREVLAAAAGEGAQVAPPCDVPDADWPELWKENLSAIVVSPKLVVRPSFVEFSPAKGQAELVIDPGQAFGTGAHASTRLALEWIDRLAPELEPGARLLDVGTGSGVLALAALRRGPGCAIGLDLDPMAVREARANALRNGLDARARFFVGSLEALASDSFELVVANLLRSEMEPLLGAIAARMRPGGRAVLSGLLEREPSRLEPALRSAGLVALDHRTMRDPSGESWVAVLTGR